MRIRINGEDVDRNMKITVETREASTLAGWVVILIGTVLAIVWCAIC